MVCLINHARAQWHMPALHQRSQLDTAAQRHTDDMVSHGYFAHNAPDGSGPGERLRRAGYHWHVLGEDLSTGYGTPQSLVNGWMSSAEHCWIMFAPYFRDLGVGVSRRPVRHAANVHGTWTADFALHAGSSQPSAGYAAANSCPH